MTDPARTTVDMLRSAQSVDVSSGFRCLEAYLAGGGSETDLMAYAMAFNSDKALAPLIKLAIQMGAGHAERRSIEIRSDQT
jgi:hypothetical protein